ALCLDLSPLAALHTIIHFFPQLTSPRCLSIQPMNLSHQHRLPNDLACNHQFERRGGLFQWQPMGDVWRDATRSEPAHEHREIPLPPGWLKATQAANG